jgi:hypothetical protein
MKQAGGRLSFPLQWATLTPSIWGMLPRQISQPRQPAASPNGSKRVVHFPRREVYGAVDLGSPTAVRERASRVDELRTLVGPQCKAVLKFVRQEAREKVPIGA